MSRAMNTSELAWSLSLCFLVFSLTCLVSLVGCAAAGARQWCAAQRRGGAQILPLRAFKRACSSTGSEPKRRSDRSEPTTTATPTTTQCRVAVLLASLLVASPPLLLASFLARRLRDYSSPLHRRSIDRSLPGRRMLATSLQPSVENDQRLLLSKAEAAFSSSSDESAKALRILQRIAHNHSELQQQQEEKKSNGVTAAATATATAAVKKLSLIAPVIAPPPPPAPLSSRESSLSVPSNSLPPLAPTLHLARSLAAASASVSSAALPSACLPSPRLPPLFLVYNNTALVHLSNNRVKLAQIFLARALEEAQELAGAVGAPSGGSGSNNSIQPVTPTSKRASIGDVQQSPPSSAVAPSSSLLSKSFSSLSSPSASSSSSTAGGSSTPISSRSRGGTADSDPLHPNLAAFLISKQLQVFFNAGAVLLRVHDSASSSSSSSLLFATNSEEEDVQVATNGLQLACRCFRHCLQLQAQHSDILQQLAALSSAASTPHPFYIHLRLGESLVLLNRYAERRKEMQSKTHPLLQTPSSAHPPPSAASATQTNGDDSLSASLSPSPPPSPSPLDDPSSLEHAVQHFQRVLVLLQAAQADSVAGKSEEKEQQQQQQQQQLAEVRNQVTVKLAYVQLTLNRPQDALSTLSSVLPHIAASPAGAALPPPPLHFSHDLLFEAELSAAECLLLLNQTDRALSFLRRCHSPAVAQCFQFAALPPAVLLAGAGASALDFSACTAREFLHALSMLVYCALARREEAQARKMIEGGLR